ncbi:hypothetical protein O3P69_002450 [Scylla paramamosain]|uniref:Uncharacterized protein n=1 Tax=Scylla paramamosain TaxID=85552 RepID=A0AAW0UP70_SCYPA
MTESFLIHPTPPTAQPPSTASLSSILISTPTLLCPQASFSHLFPVYRLCHPPASSPTHQPTANNHATKHAPTVHDPRKNVPEWPSISRMLGKADEALLSLLPGAHRRPHQEGAACPGRGWGTSPSSSPGCGLEVLNGASNQLQLTNLTCVRLMSQASAGRVTKLYYSHHTSFVWRLRQRLSLGQLKGREVLGGACDVRYATAVAVPGWWRCSSVKRHDLSPGGTALQM